MDQLDNAPAAKPIITTYPYMYWYEEGKEVFAERDKGSIIMIKDFNKDGTPHLMPHLMDYSGYRRARFLAAGFLFTSGEFVEEVPYDPDLYFGGEEITLAIRAYTNGWDMFHHSECPLYHHYIRKSSPNHWQDNPDWHTKQAQSLAKVLAILRGEPLSSCGLGSVRTLAEYEQFAGLDFQKQAISEDALNHIEP
jgi:hypothetical protein